MMINAQPIQAEPGLPRTYFQRSIDHSQTILRNIGQNLSDTFQPPAALSARLESMRSSTAQACMTSAAFFVNNRQAISKFATGLLKPLFILNDRTSDLNARQHVVNVTLLTILAKTSADITNTYVNQRNDSLALTRTKAVLDLLEGAVMVYCCSLSMKRGTDEEDSSNLIKFLSMAATIFALKALSRGLSCFNQPPRTTSPQNQPFALDTSELQAVHSEPRRQSIGAFPELADSHEISLDYDVQTLNESTSHHSEDGIRFRRAESNDL